MIHGKSVLGIIPARGGSKGIPRKNILMLAGKPLIAWTIEEAKKSKYIDRLILSSDDAEIIKVAKNWDCEVPFVRPSELARDDTPGIEPILHALNTLKEKYDYAVLLQPTSPLRSVDDIDGCIETCLTSRSPSCVSITEVDQHPNWMYTIDANGYLLPFTQQANRTYCRQDLPRIYILNGAVYVSESDVLRDCRSFITNLTKAYVMPQERALDIDKDIDLTLFEITIQKKK